MIDEIQNVEGWEHLINSYSQDFVDSYEVFISGSNSKMLSHNGYPYPNGPANNIFTSIPHIHTKTHQPVLSVLNK